MPIECVQDTDDQSFSICAPDAEAEDAEWLDRSVFRRVDAGDDRLLQLSDVVSNWMSIEESIVHDTVGLDPDELGSWSWLLHLPPQDLPEFITEMRQTVQRACQNLDPFPLLMEIDAWRETAFSLSDPMRQEILLTEVITVDTDFVEVLSPGNPG